MGVLDEEHLELMNMFRRLKSNDESMQTLLGILESHFAREEDFVMPLLNSLHYFADTDRQVVTLQKLRKLSDYFVMLKRDYNLMKEEHRKISEIARNIINSGRADKNVVESINILLHHAELEEQVLYPSALVLGMYISGYLEKERGSIEIKRKKA